MILAASSISKCYGGMEILRDCSLSVESGECVLLQGPSGGGKSTFLRILALLETADAGYIQHGDISLDANVPAKRSAYPFLTVVFQQLFLWPNLSMRDNLALVLNHDLSLPLPPSAIDMLERFNIKSVLEQRPHECSLGQRQRLAVVRALLSDARFLLLDEPSSALDRANREVLVQELRAALAQDRGILLISHDDGAYKDLADKVFDLDGGLIRSAQ